MTKLEESTIEHLDEEWEIACESQYHEMHPKDHEGHAEFWTVNTCTGTKLFQCRKYVQRVVVSGFFKCTKCGVGHPASMLHYEEIKR